MAEVKNGSRTSENKKIAFIARFRSVLAHKIAYCGTKSNIKKCRTAAQEDDVALT